MTKLQREIENSIYVGLEKSVHYEYERERFLADLDDAGLGFQKTNKANAISGTLYAFLFNVLLFGTLTGLAALMQMAWDRWTR